MLNPIVRGLLAALGAVLICYGAYWYWTNGGNPHPMNEPPTAVLDRLEKQGIPEIRLPRNDGSEFQLSKISDQIILLNFWASWCDPCVREYPSMLELVQKMKGRLRLVAVSADENKEDMLKFLKTFGGAKQANVDILWDPEMKLAELMGTQKLPESFVLSKDHKLLRKVVGLEAWSTPNVLEYFEEVAGGQ